MRENILHKCAALLAICLYAVIFSSCEGMFDGIYDSPQDNGYDTSQETKYGFVSYDSLSHKGVLYLDMTDYKRWTYLSFKDMTLQNIAIPETLTGNWDGHSGISYQYVTGKEYTLDTMIKTDAQTDALYWDLALHRFDARVKGGAYMTDYNSLDELLSSGKDFDNAEFVSDEYTDNQVMTDISSMFSFRIGYQNINCNKVLSSWLDMDISTPPPVFTPSGKVYIVRFDDGNKAALHLDSYVSDSGVKGYLTISFIYPY